MQTFIAYFVFKLPKLEFQIIMLHIHLNILLLKMEDKAWMKHTKVKLKTWNK